MIPAICSEKGKTLEIVKRFPVGLHKPWGLEAIKDKEGNFKEGANFNKTSKKKKKCLKSQEVITPAFSKSQTRDGMLGSGRVCWVSSIKKLGVSEA